MQVSVETTSPTERRMTVGIPKERIEPEIQKRLKDLARTVRINGFRPGKVPVRVVEQKYGGQIRYEVINEVIYKSFQEAVQQENLRVAGEPKFEVQFQENQIQENQTDTAITYTASFSIYPEGVTLHVEGLTVEKPISQVTESDIDTMLERLRQQRQNWDIVKMPASQGDRVVVNFQGTIDGQAFEGNEVKQIPIILGKNEFMFPEWEEKLVGHQEGETLELDVTFPQDHKNSQLAGKVVHFRVEVQNVAVAKLPELNADFAKSLGVEDGSIETLRHDARENMERELEHAIKLRIKHQLLEALLNANPIHAPATLVQEEAQRVLKNRQQQNLPKAATQHLTSELFQQEAERRVKLGLLLSELVKKNNIQVQPEKVRQMVERIASTYEDPQSVINWYYADQQRLSEVQSMVLEDEVVEWLLQHTQLTEKPMGFYEVMTPPYDQRTQVANS